MTWGQFGEKKYSIKSIIFGLMDMKNIKLVATDLDGTFLKDDRSVSQENLRALHLLGKKQIVRVVATGRNLRKVTEVIARDVPFDYIVYSSGAGIFDWKKQEHIFHQNIGQETASHLVEYFRQKDYNFYAFAPAPENHRLWYHKGTQDCEEFNRYFSFHNSFSEPLPENGKWESGLCQFMLIIPEDDSIFEQVKNEIEGQHNEIRVIRSSSPVTKGYIWVEVFHREVSKGNGVKHVCNLLHIHPGETFGIGNDYNDLDLLDFTAHSFLTENAPEQIKSRFHAVPSNEDDAFAHAVQPLLE
ncbi:HAD family phosphatase [Mariniphaga sediminis]|uniref:HAD family phosphatase n=4 Tax=Mariniphaga sediminis TaxID=1628158 RepID=A0A399D5R6_9BACT|nr:HAD family phosphatase [Mariniphaga sediminis]RIH66548.1 HAD family phosphatase [Mariniphaga sediminis]